MLGVSAMLGNSGDGAAAAAEVQERGGTTSNGGGGGEVGVVGPSSVGLSEEETVRIEESDRNSGGNRWPRQETLALLKIRSDMDVAFRDSSLKGPLWEEVSRKLAELGFHRSAKKCKEKFENVYKYHRRTKDGRSSKPDGKTYRFFDQLQALENQPPSVSFLLPPQPPQTHQAPPAPPPVAVTMPGTNPPILSPSPVSTVPSTANPISVSQNTVSLIPSLNPSSNMLPPPPPPQPPQSVPPPTTTANLTNLSYSTAIPNMSANIASISTSSSTSSDEEPERRCKRKRKWADFFQRLMNEVIEKQEEMQKKFLETLEKRERDRVAREEAWRVQEIARLNREHDLLLQERSIAASKDTAVIAYLQKISGQEVVPNVAAQLQMQLQTRSHGNSTPPAAQPPPPPPQPQPVQQPPPPLPIVLSQPSVQTLSKSVVNPKTDNGRENFVPASSSRWPKAEVQALIQLRTNMDLKYQENGPKGPLWEEMSAAMRKLGYNRSPKRCKEKWENINKYFKKVKESNKKRPEDSKTCPYFHQLDALYREKAIAVKSENPTMMVPIMVQPEQQWPLAPDQEQQQHHRREHSEMEDLESENMGDNHENDEGEDEDEDEDDEAGGFEIVANKPSSVGTTE